MNYTQGRFLITKKRALAADVYHFVLHCPEIAKAAVPGQFAHVLPEGFSLRRPISIAGIDPEAGTIHLVMEIRGKGTAALAACAAGDCMDLLAPLGHGFTLCPQASRVLLVGGGIGVPPLLPLADYYGEKAVSICGFRSYPQVILQEDFRKRSVKTILCTEDGTAGALKGNVSEPLAALLEEGADMVYACGPHPMLRAVARACERFDIRCEVSLEERMACGIGACLGCAVRIRDEAGETYRHVCKDGPVFDAREVVW